MPSDEDDPRTDSPQGVESTTDPPTSTTPVDAPTVSLPEPSAALKIGIFGVLSAILLLIGVSGFSTPNADIAYPIIFTIAGVSGLVACYAAWRAGGFENIRRLRTAKIVSSTFSRIMLWVHSFGSVVAGISVFFAFLTAMAAVVGQPDLAATWAQIALYGIAGGLVITSLTKGRDSTLAGRMTSLQESLKSGQSATDLAFGRLAEAQSTLESVQKDIEHRSRALEQKMSENAKLAEIMGVEPEKVRALIAASWKTNMWLSVVSIVMTFVGFAMGLIAPALGWDTFVKNFLHH